MFHPEVKPESILLKLMDDSISTIANLEDAGYPLNEIPPHMSSVFLITKENDESYVGMGKSDIEVLTNLDRDMWASRALFRLDCESDDYHHPLGTFIGFVGTSQGAPDLLLFFGILISPSGTEAEGMYVELRDTSEIHKLWKHPFELAPHLQTYYIPMDKTLVH